MAQPTANLTKATVLLSGGIDSAALAHTLKTQGYDVVGLFIDYGQAARVAESTAVEALAEPLGIEVRTIKVSEPTGFGAGELIGRNAFLILTAIFLGCVHHGLIAIGIHAGTPYFDCTPAFVDQMKRLVEEHTDGRLTLVAPFVDWHKPQIVSYFRDAGLPIAPTYSCESGTIPPCGTCASCRDREALAC